MKVLIVDDNEMNRKLLRVNLEGEGLRTFEATDGIQALAALEKQKADVIISDILMPHMDGYRLCQEVRKHATLESTPFIFYTSTYTSSGDEKLALDCGADRYIKKPAPLAVIMSALRELSDPRVPRPRPAELPEELLVMREYNEALVRKLEERNAKIERAREEILRANAGLERRVEERTAELVLANQELEAFSHSIAHDLRSPLTAIDGFSQLVARDCRGKVADETMEHLEFICRAVHRMNELTDDLLRLSRASRAEIRRENVDFSRLARGVIDNLRGLKPDRVVSVKIPDGLIANADAALLRIALENLLGNAWKFTCRTPNPEIEVGVHVSGGGERTYFIRDNGAGFDMALAAKLFGAFERLHAQDDFPGIGIGLTTVQRIVRRHGGAIQAQSAKGCGATFFFDLGPSDGERAR